MRDRELRPEVPYLLREWLGPKIDALARAAGSTDYFVYDEGYVGTVELPRADLESELHDAGFSWDPLSLYHRTTSGETSDGTWAYRDSPLADRQLHVVLFERGPDRTAVYAHDEPSWLRHPVDHTLMDDIRREEGSTRMRRWLDDLGLPIEEGPEAEPDSPLARLAERLRERFGQRLPVGA